MTASGFNLSDAFAAQLAMQAGTYGKNPQLLSDEERIDFIRWNILAATDELHEALAETGWKPWASSRHVNTEAFHAEMVDVFHFFMNLCLATGLTADMLLEGYQKKRQLNMERQKQGYDGVAGKCPKCRRALDDPSTICKYNPVSTLGNCETFGAFSA